MVWELPLPLFTCAQSRLSCGRGDTGYHRRWPSLQGAMDESSQRVTCIEVARTGIRFRKLWSAYVLLCVTNRSTDASDWVCAANTLVAPPPDVRPTTGVRSAKWCVSASWGRGLYRTECVVAVSLRSAQKPTHDFAVDELKLPSPTIRNRGYKQMGPLALPLDRPKSFANSVIKPVYPRTLLVPARLSSTVWHLCPRSTSTRCGPRQSLPFHSVNQTS